MGERLQLVGYGPRTGRPVYRLVLPSVCIPVQAEGVVLTDLDLAVLRGVAEHDVCFEAIAEAIWPEVSDDDVCLELGEWRRAERVVERVVRRLAAIGLVHEGHRPSWNRDRVQAGHSFAWEYRCGLSPDGRARLEEEDDR